MKCENCPALRTKGYEYPEEYCGAGIPDNQLHEFEDGSVGCRYSKKRILQRMDRMDRLEASQYEWVDVWYEEHQGKETAMLTALKEELEGYRYGGLQLCFKDDESYYPLNGNGWMSAELAGLIMMKYEELEEKVQEQFCEKCRFRDRPQKCACCRRNRKMRDLYDVEPNKQM